MFLRTSMFCIVMIGNHCAHSGITSPGSFLISRNIRHRNLPGSASLDPEAHHPVGCRVHFGSIIGTYPEHHHLLDCSMLHSVCIVVAFWWM